MLEEEQMERKLKWPVKREDQEGLEEEQLEFLANLWLEEKVQ